MNADRENQLRTWWMGFVAGASLMLLVLALTGELARG